MRGLVPGKSMILTAEGAFSHRGPAVTAKERDVVREMKGKARRRLSDALCPFCHGVGPLCLCGVATSVSREALVTNGKAFEHLCLFWN